MRQRQTKTPPNTRRLTKETLQRMRIVRRDGKIGQTTKIKRGDRMYFFPKKGEYHFSRPSCGCVGHKNITYADETILSAYKDDPIEIAKRAAKNLDLRVRKVPKCVEGVLIFEFF